MIYTLEFYWVDVDEDGGREQIPGQWQPAKSQEVVEARARATIKNVLLGGRRTNLCLIKDSRGKMLSAVVGSRPKQARPAASTRTDPLIPSSA